MRIPQMLPRVARRSAARAALVGLAALGLAAAGAGAKAADGLIDDETYESPSYGYEVEWASSWTPDGDGTSAKDGLETLSLTNEGNTGNARVIGLGAEADPAEYIDLWVVDNAASGDFEVVELGVDDGVAYALFQGDPTGDQTVVLYIEARELEEVSDTEGVLATFILSLPAAFETNIETANEDIEVGGDPLFLAADAVTGDENDERSDRDAEEDDADRDDREADDDRRGEDDEDGRGSRADDEDERSDRDHDRDQDNDDGNGSEDEDEDEEDDIL